MDTSNNTAITVETTINSPVEKVWDCWTAPEHITNWYQASDDWHAPHAENDLQKGGRFKTRMEAKDGSFGFDFGGTYINIEERKTISFTLDDNRKVTVDFIPEEGETRVVETFEPENVHPPEFQRGGWQAILNNFKNYVEREQS